MQGEDKAVRTETSSLASITDDTVISMAVICIMSTNGSMDETSHAGLS